MNEFLKENFNVISDKDVVYKKTPVKGKTVLKIFALIMEICFFLPLCTVSCSGQKLPINGLDATFGTKAMGETIEGNILCILLMLIPIAILAVLFMKNLYEKTYAYLITGAVPLVQLIILFVFKSRIIEQAEEYSATVKFNNGFYMNIISSILVIIVSAVMYYMIYKMDLPVVSASYGQNIQTSNQMSKKKCTSCGAMVNEDAKFCSKCGYTFEKKEENSQKVFCSECGAELNPDMQFCTECGSKR